MIHETIKKQNRCRYFLRHGPRTYMDRGFRSKDEIEFWIRSFRLDWRVGYLFHIRGEDFDSQIVS